MVNIIDLINQNNGKRAYYALLLLNLRRRPLYLL